MRKRAVTAAIVASATAAAFVLAGTGAASAATAPATIPHSKPSWVAKATQVGASAATAAVSARVYLAPKGGLDGLKAAALAVSTPGTASYHHFLSTAQYQKFYGVPSSTVSTISAYLKAAGFTVAGVGADNRYVAVSGTTVAAQTAFHASIKRYVRSGKTVQAPSTALTIPANLAGLVTSVTGLDTSSTRMKPNAPTPSPPPAGFRNARPCSISSGQVAATYQADYKTKLPKFEGQTLAYAVCGYTGPQLRSAYEGSTTLTGAGVTVGILDAYAAPTIVSDANTYAVDHGDGSYAKGQLTQTTPATYTEADASACDASGWFGEETLDVEAVHAMAPAANIHYYAAKSCEDNDFVDALATVVSQDKVTILSDSWGDAGESADAAEVNAYDQVLSSIPGRNQCSVLLRRQWRRTCGHGHQTGRFPRIGPAGDRGRWHLDGNSLRRGPRRADRLGHREVLPVRGWVLLDSGRLPLRCRWWLVGPVQQARLPVGNCRQRAAGA